MNTLHARKGFSFPEILFAVMILGVGMIMVASMLPIGIKMSQDTADNAVAQSVGHAAVQMFTVNLPATPLLDLPDIVVYNPITVAPLNGSRIGASDPRYASIVLYKWNGTSGTEMDVYAFVAKSRRNDTYTDQTPTQISGTLSRDLIPKSMAGVIFTDNFGQSPDSVEFPASTTTVPNRKLIAEGSFIIVANYTPDLTTNGQIYRVGRAIDEVNGEWELLPGFDLQQTTVGPKPTDPAGATVFVLGKQLQDPETNYNESGVPPNLVEGLTQDIAIYQSKVIAP